ncbi:MAG: amino acid ABC transporter permease [Geoalkalibacter sp.]|jgi:polar amino acid transport system permease protein|uniref:amino acid ABC transporter permease n=1 Tax=Geoalkalibacter sp. TaxID=3041440 RepID=UPI002A9B0170|nr:amino acid ABC transporter permease [Thermodesulfobacteriota bacterium]
MLDWSVIVHYFPFLLKGALLTLQISAVSLVLGLAVGLVAALCILSRNPLLQWPARFYVWIVRATPLLVQLFLIYFGLPQFGVDFSPFWSGVLALALNTGAYNAETIRAGILAVPKGQIEAARSLGMGPSLTMRRIVLPQAVRMIIPPLGNNFVILIKDTSLVSTITLVELTLTAQRLIGSTYKPFEMYLMAALLYAVLTTTADFLLRQFERRTLGVTA